MKRPPLWVIISGAVLLALFALLWLRGSTYRDQRDEAVAGRAADRVAYASAQDRAKADQIAAVRAIEARYATLAEKADHATQTALADAQRSSELFIRNSRLWTEGSGCPSGRAGDAAGDSTESGDRSGSSPELVVVPAEDVRICTTNTTRLEQVRDWALGL